MRLPEPLNVLVTDFDFCASTPHGNRPDLLSAPLVEKAVTEHFAGFYGCTHRCTNTVWLSPIVYFFARVPPAYSWETIKACVNTSAITRLFAKATGLTCFAVSMVEDYLYGDDQCGHVFKEIIQPQEEEELAVTSEKRYLSQYRFLQHDSGSKNPQLMQIARDIVKRRPNTPIILHYIDDKLRLCEEALSVTAEPGWPKQVDIRAFQHYANSGHAVITPVLAKRITAPMSPAAVCRRIGLFAFTAVTAAAATAVFASQYYRSN